MNSTLLESHVASEMALNVLLLRNLQTVLRRQMFSFVTRANVISHKSPVNSQWLPVRSKSTSPSDQKRRPMVPKKKFFNLISTNFFFHYLFAGIIVILVFEEVLRSVFRDFQFYFRMQRERKRFIAQLDEEDRQLELARSTK